MGVSFLPSSAPPFFHGFRNLSALVALEWDWCWTEWEWASGEQLERRVRRTACATFLFFLEETCLQELRRTCGDVRVWEGTASTSVFLMTSRKKTFYHVWGLTFLHRPPLKLTKIVKDLLLSVPFRNFLLSWFECCVWWLPLFFSLWPPSLSLCASVWCVARIHCGSVSMWDQWWMFDLFPLKVCVWIWMDYLCLWKSEIKLSLNRYKDALHSDLFEEINCTANTLIHMYRHFGCGTKESRVETLKTATVELLHICLNPEWETLDQLKLT